MAAPELAAFQYHTTSTYGFSSGKTYLAAAQTGWHLAPFFHAGFSAPKGRWGSVNRKAYTQSLYDSFGIALEEQLCSFKAAVHFQKQDKGVSLSECEARVLAPPVFENSQG